MQAPGLSPALYGMNRDEVKSLRPKQLKEVMAALALEVLHIHVDADLGLGLDG